MSGPSTHARTASNCAQNVQTVLFGCSCTWGMPSDNARPEWPSGRTGGGGRRVHMTPGHNTPVWLGSARFIFVPFYKGASGPHMHPTTLTQPSSPVEHVRRKRRTVCTGPLTRTLFTGLVCMVYDVRRHHGPLQIGAASSAGLLKRDLADCRLRSEKSHPDRPGEATAPI